MSWRVVSEMSSVSRIRRVTFGLPVDIARDYEGNGRAWDAAEAWGPARSVWAKHDRDAEGWLPLWRHMEDSAAVAGLVWDRWLPSAVRALIADALPGGVADARALAVWLAGVHDIGKATLLSPARSINWLT